MGKDLLVQLALATDLPFGYIFSELEKMAQKKGLKLEALSVEDIRALTASLLHDIILETLPGQAQH